jgi:hypothetical protein
LSKILGIDVDAYVNEHLEVYEEAKKKWEGCTMEEWVAGADGAWLLTSVSAVQC